MKQRRIWSGFYKKALKERQNQLKLVFPSLFNDNEFPYTGLDGQLANNMIENCIGTIGLPVGLGLNFVINSKSIVVPMVIEEPSVVAAVSGAAKTICEFTGFEASSSERNTVISQVQLLDVPDDHIDQAIYKLEKQKQYIICLANTFCPSMVKRGGGVTEMVVRKLPKTGSLSAPDEFLLMCGRSEQCSYWLVVHLIIDVKDAMGANAASTVAEAVAPYLAEITKSRIGIRIVSNYTIHRKAKASFKIPVSCLAYKGLSGQELACRLLEAYQWAKDDPFRATTYNKGIMNGIDAAALAVGQDWRAIEAACHVDACQAGFGKYQPLSKFWVDEMEGEFYFCGSMELPLSVGTKGGVLDTNPIYRYNLGLLGNPDSKELSQILVCVGLAQNFAAIRALVSEGIQRGHMSLHASNIAIAAKAPPHAINECVAYMIESKRINLSAAREYIEAHALHQNITAYVSHTSDNESRSSSKAPSIFYFNGCDDDFVVNIAFKTIARKPVYIELTEKSNSSSDFESREIVEKLLGDKTHSWLVSIFQMLEKMKIHTIRSQRKNEVLSRKLKLLVVLNNIFIKRCLTFYPKETREFIERILKLTEKVEVVDRNGLIQCNSNDLFQNPILQSTDQKDLHMLHIAFPLIVAIWQVFEIRVNQWVGQSLLTIALLEEYRRIVSSLIEYNEFKEEEQLEDQLKRSMLLNSKRFQVTIFLFCDAISCDPQLITLKSLQFLTDIGSYLEQGQSIAHDLSSCRIARDLLSIHNNPERLQLSWNGKLDYGYSFNSFVLWLLVIKKIPKNQISEGNPPVFRLAQSSSNLHNILFDYIKEFVEIYQRPAMQNINLLFFSGALFDNTKFESITKLYREYYQVTALYNRLS